MRAAGPPRSLPAAALWRCWPGQLAEESRLFPARPSHRPGTTFLEVQPATFCWQLGHPWASRGAPDGSLCITLLYYHQPLLLYP